jgi:hypothetical protein
MEPHRQLSSRQRLLLPEVMTLLSLALTMVQDPFPMARRGQPDPLRHLRAARASATIFASGISPTSSGSSSTSPHPNASPTPARNRSRREVTEAFACKFAECGFRPAKPLPVRPRRIVAHGHRRHVSGTGARSWRRSTPPRLADGAGLSPGRRARDWSAAAPAGPRRSPFGIVDADSPRQWGGRRVWSPGRALR